MGIKSTICQVTTDNICCTVQIQFQSLARSPKQNSDKQDNCSSLVTAVKHNNDHNLLSA